MPKDNEYLDDLALEHMQRVMKGILDEVRDSEPEDLVQDFSRLLAKVMHHITKGGIDVIYEVAGSEEMCHTARDLCEEFIDAVTELSNESYLKRLALVRTRKDESGGC